MTFKELIEANLIFETTTWDELTIWGIRDSEEKEKYKNRSGIYIGPNNWFYGLGLNKNLRFCEDNEKFEELGYFITSLSNSNPQAVLTLFTPEKYIKIKSELLSPLFEHKEDFISKKLIYNLKNYANSIFEKAKGKKATPQIPQPIRDEIASGKIRDITDFCYIPTQPAIKLSNFLKKYNLKEENCGAAKIYGGVDLYALYYDWPADPDIDLSTFIELYCKNGDSSKGDMLAMVDFKNIHETLTKRMKKANYNGFVDIKNWTIKCSGIPKGEEPICTFQFNSQAYNNYRKYLNRYNDWNSSSVSNNPINCYNGEIMAKCIGYLYIARDLIFTGKIIDPDDYSDNYRDILLNIKNCKTPYHEVVNSIERLRDDIYPRTIFSSNLPILQSDLNYSELDNILMNIRIKYYNK